MKLLYAAYSRLPSRRANSIQVASTCDALAQAGHDVTLLLPNRGSNRKSTSKGIRKYYRLRERFEIKRLPVLDVRFLHDAGLLKPWFLIAHLSFTLSFLNFIRGRASRYDAVYTRHAPTALMYGKLRRLFPLLPIIFEAHRYGTLNALAAEWVDGVVATTGNAASLFASKCGCPVETVPNGIRLEDFDIDESKASARKKLGLSKKAGIALYTGKPYGWKGVEVLEEAAKRLPSGSMVLFVGPEKKGGKSGPGKKRYAGYVPHKDIPLYLKAADVLVLPNAPQGESRLFTSPLKMFEYMASKRPIVASDLKSIREILSEDECFFAKAGDPDSLASAMTKALHSPKEAGRRAEKAYLKARDNYTWSKRAEKIGEFIGGAI